MVLKEYQVTIPCGYLGDLEATVLVTIEDQQITIVKFWVLGAHFDYAQPRLETLILKQIDMIRHDQESADADHQLKAWKEAR